MSAGLDLQLSTNRKLEHLQSRAAASPRTVRYRVSDRPRGEPRLAGGLSASIDQESTSTIGAPVAARATAAIPLSRVASDAYDWLVPITCPFFALRLNRN